MSSQKQKPCPVCGSLAFVQEDFSTGDKQYECPRCGIFRCSSEFDEDAGTDGVRYLGPANSRKRANLSAWLREKADSRERQKIRAPRRVLESSFYFSKQSDELRDEFETAGTPSFHEKAVRLLRAIDEQTDHAGEEILIDLSGPQELEWEARAWALNKDEFSEICDYLASEKMIVGCDSFQSMNLKLLPKGWARLDEIEPTHQDSDQGFVAMWFDDEVFHIYDDALAPGIRAGGYNPFKINDRPSADRIDVRIESEIEASCFMVADATGKRPSVYYEAGYARAIGIPVIWTCREDYFKKLPFDTRQFHCYEWNKHTIDKLIGDLQKAIVEICGRGPL